MPKSEIGVGAVFTRHGVLLPPGVRIEDRLYVRGWSTVIAKDSFTLDKNIRASGWGFFFMAGEIKALCFGRYTASNIRGAIVRALAKVPHEFNAAEITAVEGKRFLGLTFVTVRAHSRRIQNHPYLYSSDRPMPRFAVAQS